MTCLVAARRGVAVGLGAASDAAARRTVRRERGERKATGYPSVVLGAVRSFLYPFSCSWSYFYCSWGHFARQQRNKEVAPGRTVRRERGGIATTDDETFNVRCVENHVQVAYYRQKLTKLGAGMGGVGGARVPRAVAQGKTLHPTP